LAHAARHDDAVLFLDERRKLPWPQHQIFAIDGRRKLLPFLWVLPPLGLHLQPDALKFLQRSRLVLLCLNGDAALAQQCVSGVDRCLVRGEVLGQVADGPVDAHAAFVRTQGLQ